MKKIISFCIISALMLSACSKTTTESMIVSTTPTNESSAVVSEETTETTMPVEDREDFILTNNWVFQDNSILMFSDNDTFTYYQSRDNLEDNYYTGTYEFYTGQAAYDYIGSRRDGAFAEYVAAPVWNLIPLDKSISFTAAAMLEPLSVALHAVKQGNLKENGRAALL